MITLLKASTCGSYSQRMYFDATANILKDKSIDVVQVIHESNAGYEALARRECCRNGKRCNSCHRQVIKRSRRDFRMVLDSSCIFCNEIITKRNAAIVAENDMVISFMDNAPVEPGHILVIPKEHFENIFDIDGKYYIEVQLMAKRVAKAVMKAMGADGINIGQNNGWCANQRVMHFHVHVIPRWCDKPFKWGRLNVSFDYLLETAEKIAKVYNEMEKNGDFD